MLNDTYAEKLSEFCEKDQELIEDVKSFFKHKIEYISGLRTLKELLKV